jgi:hypothetical protein
MKGSKLYYATLRRLSAVYGLAKSERCSADELRDLFKAAQSVCAALEAAWANAAADEDCLRTYHFLDEEENAARDVMSLLKSCGGAGR